MGSYLITGTQDLDPKGSPTADLLARCLMAYLQHRSSLMPVAGPLRDLDWGELWTHYSQLLHHHPAVIILHPGSLGDPISDHLTVADWARDWRLPLILTLSLGKQTLPLAAAYTALARQAKAKLIGFVLFHPHDYTLPELAEIPLEIQTLTGVPILGGLPQLALERADEQELARWAATLNWEQMRWE